MDEVVFGRYRLISVIGQGGMGTVYRAHDTEIDRDVAIKVLSPQLASEPGYEQRFRREAHTAARLSEPHIIPIYDTGEIDGQLYLVMPIVEGADVAELLHRDGPMAARRAVHIIEQLASALDAAHAVGLVHRDIKPSNTLITGRDFAYLIDFGIAHDASATKLTNTGMIVGTMAYMAPERFTAGISDARSDVYALACVLHECLTGDHPFPGDSMEQQIAGHLSLTPPRPTHSRPNLPAALDHVIATGMAKNPDERYQSAHDLATAARKALTSASSRIRHTARPLDATRPAPALPPPPVDQSSQSRLPTQLAGPQPRAPVQGRNQRQTLGIVAAVVVAGLAAAGIYAGTRDSNKPAAVSTTATPISTTAIASTPTSTTPTGPAPVAESALEGLLLSPDEISDTMGAAGMTVIGPKYPTSTYGGDGIADKACEPLYGPAESDAYSSSGYGALFGQELKRPSNDYPLVTQYVVSFSSARAADAFFADSAQNWPACSNRQFTFTGDDGRQSVWTVGPVANTNSILSATRNMTPYSVGRTNYTGSCQRALTVANNVAIDVRACAKSPGRTAVNIALGIAAKVPRT